MITTIFGTNQYALLAKLRQIKFDYTKTYGDFGLSVINADEKDYNAVLDAVATSPFLAEKNLVIIKDASKNSQISEKIQELFGAVSSATDVVFYETKIDKRSVLYKYLKKNTDCQEYLDLDNNGLATWLVNEAELRGGSIGKVDAVYLVNRVMLSQEGLSNELDKLLSFDGNITRTTIDALSEPAPQGTVFDLLENAFRGNKAKAYELYESQRKQQVEAQEIMAMIAWQVHILAVVNAFKGSNSQQISSKTNLNPYVVSKTQSLANAYTKQDIKNLLSRTIDLDRALKTTSVDADEAILAYITDL